MTIGKEFLKIKSKEFKSQGFVTDKILSSSRFSFIKMYKGMYVTIMPVIKSGMSKEDIITNVTIGKLIPEVYMHRGSFEPLIRTFELGYFMMDDLSREYGQFVSSQYTSADGMVEDFNSILQKFEETKLDQIVDEQLNSSHANSKYSFTLNVVEEYYSLRDKLLGMDINETFIYLKDKYYPKATVNFKKVIATFFTDGETMLEGSRQSFDYFFRNPFEKNIKTSVDEKNKFFMFCRFKFGVKVDDYDIQILTEQYHKPHPREDTRSIIYSMFVTFIEYPKRKEWEQLSKNHDKLFVN